MEMAAIVAMEAQAACEGEGDLTERIRKAMRAARNHWMAPGENDQFRGAIAGALMASQGDERDRIERSAKALNRLGAMLQALQAGVPADLEGMAAEKQEDDLIPLRKIWDEVREAA